MKPISKFLTHIRLIHHEHKTIGKGMLSVITFVLITRLIGAMKEIIVAWKYGVGSELDAYLFIINLTNLPIAIWSSVVFAILIPSLVKLQEKAPEELLLFRKEAYAVTSIISVLSGLAFALLLNSEFLLVNIGGLPANTAQLAAQIAVPLALTVPFGFFLALLSADTMAKKKHANTLLEACPAMVIICFLFFCYTDSIDPLIWGTIAGIFIQMLLLSGYVGKLSGVPLPSLSLSSRIWKTFKRSVLVLLLGQVLQALTGVVDQLWAARLSEGTIAELGYANRITGLIISLGATAISRAALPVLSTPSKGEEARRQRLVYQWAILMLISGLLAIAVLIPLAPAIVKLLFERGAFSQDNTASVARLLQYGLLQIPFYFTGLVFVSQIAATRNYSYLTLAAGISLLTKLLGNSFAIKHFGAAGLFLTTALMYLISALIQFAVIRSGLAKPANED